METVPLPVNESPIENTRNDVHRDDFHVVLVETGESLNVGSVARAMSNLGFPHLHLVAPRNFDRDRATVTACWGAPLLDTMQVHTRLEDALAEMEEAVAFSGRVGDNPARSTTLPQWARRLPRQVPRKTALVFGCEAHGLRQEHLELCRWSVRIPAAEACPSFNLAQSVLLTLYEMTRTFQDAPIKTAGDTDETGAATAVELPTSNEFFQLDRLIDAVMVESGFVRAGTPPGSPGTLRALFRRIEPSRHEMGLLLGLFGRVQTALRRAHHDPNS